MVEIVSEYAEKKDNVYTDMVLIVEGREFHVCKSTLASFSDVCKNLFFGDRAESKNPILITAHQFQSALDLIYHKIEVTEKNVQDLLEAGTNLQMKTVVKRCEKALLSEDSTLHFSKEEKLVLADRFVLNDLLDNLIKTNATPKAVEAIIPKETATLSDSTVIRILQGVKDAELKKKREDAERIAQCNRQMQSWQDSEDTRMIELGSVIPFPPPRRIGELEDGRPLYYQGWGDFDEEHYNYDSW